MSWNARREDWNPQAEDARDSAAIDYSRVIHSASFRRLQGKTQILNLGDSDFYRTRLTHSLEVAQVAGGIVEQFRKDYAGEPEAAALPSVTMIQALGAVHDLGHPPFGHGGEVALNYCMAGHGGFEGNGQTLRILSRLEKFSANAGANLTRRTLLGILKYPVPFSIAANPALKPGLAESPSIIRIIDRAASKPPKCYLDTEREVVDWILEPLSTQDRDRFCELTTDEGKHGSAAHKSFDCSIMDLADDIAFGVHDLEDAIALELMSEGDFRALVPEESCASFLDRLKERYRDEFGNDVYDGFTKGLFGEGSRRKRLIGRMVNHLITSCRIFEVDDFKETVIRYRAMLPPRQAIFLKALKRAVAERVIKSPGVQHLEFKGQGMVVAVFEALASEPKAFLPWPTQARYDKAEDKRRVICDHVSGMTDAFLLRTYERLFSPRMGSVFDRL
jgi:dGTPase